MCKQCITTSDCSCDCEDRLWVTLENRCYGCGHVVKEKGFCCLKIFMCDLSAKVVHGMCQEYRDNPDPLMPYISHRCMECTCPCHKK